MEETGAKREGRRELTSLKQICEDWELTVQRERETENNYVITFKVGLDIGILKSFPGDYNL